MLAQADEPYQLVLMDWKMPGMNGIEATRQIRRLPNLGDIPTVIMVTAHGREEVMRQAQDAALDGFLIKPVGQSILFETLLSTFGHIVHLQPSASKAEAAVDKMAEIAGARILVVEDNAINQQIAREVLEQAGLHVTLAENGREAVQKVNEEAFDAVLMDLQMPEMDGYEATRIIRSDARFADLPIIAMTAHAMVEEREKCLAAGMNGHTPKPIDLPHLFGLLRTWIKPGMRAQTHSQHKLTDASILPDSMSGIDVAACLQNLGGNEALLQTLLLEFRKEFSDTGTRIRALLEQGDVHAVEGLAHKIKGTAGNLSATTLYEAASALDAALRQAHPDHLPDLLDAFSTALDEAMQSIGSLEQEAADRDDDVDMDMEQVRPLLAELAGLIEDSSMDADHCFQRLKQHLHHPSVQKEMQQLEAAINDFDFEGAKSVLAQITEVLE